MKAGGTIRTTRDEAGIALLISIFVLLLISVVAIALIVSSGTESALAGNYRSSTGVYYAALAGIEEARGRLSPKDPNSFKTWASFYPAPGTTLPIGTIGYVLNPGPTETASSLLTTYPDTEYDSEFGAGKLAAATGAGTVKTTPSVWNSPPLINLPFPGPLYKWVRLNAVSEKSLNLDVDADGLPDSTTPLFYDGAHFSNNNNSGALPQVFEITSLSVLPNSSGQSSQKLVQYLAAPTPIPLPPFLAALTLSDSPGPGNNAIYHAPANNSNFLVKGDDYDCNGNPTGSGAVVAIGVFQAPDKATVKGGIQPTPLSVASNYTGSSTAPDVDTIPNTLTPAQLNAMVQTIQQVADATVPQGSANMQKNFLNTLGMSPSNVLTVVVNGDLDLSGWGGTGYGLLLVTGTLYYDPSTSWNGIILVVGNGVMTNKDKHVNGRLNGAVYVANTVSGSNLGGAIASFSDDMDGDGIRYSSCWIQRAQPFTGYKILSYHEIAQ